jgi:hypothetical protein
MLHACVERFDVMGGRENILGWDGEVNKATLFLPHGTECVCTEKKLGALVDLMSPGPLAHAAASYCYTNHGLITEAGAGGPQPKSKGSNKNSHSPARAHASNDAKKSRKIIPTRGSVSVDSCVHVLMCMITSAAHPANCHHEWRQAFRMIFHSNLNFGKRTNIHVIKLV